WKRLKFKIKWQNEEYCVEITRNKIILKSLSSIRQPLSVKMFGKEYLLYPNQALKVTY
ncbi:unnamed protein product, partial [marine sediment metagenome]